MTERIWLNEAVIDKLSAPVLRGALLESLAEIERLQAALRRAREEIISFVGDDHPPISTGATLCEIDAALSGKGEES